MKWNLYTKSSETPTTPRADRNSEPERLSHVKEEWMDHKKRKRLPQESVVVVIIKNIPRHYSLEIKEDQRRTLYHKLYKIFFP